MALLNNEEHYNNQIYEKNEIDAYFYTGLVTEELQYCLKKYINLKISSGFITFKIPYSLGDFKY